MHAMSASNRASGRRQRRIESSRIAPHPPNVVSGTGCGTVCVKAPVTVPYQPRGHRGITIIDNTRIAVEPITIARVGRARISGTPRFGFEGSRKESAGSSAAAVSHVDHCPKRNAMMNGTPPQSHTRCSPGREMANTKSAAPSPLNTALPTRNDPSAKGIQTNSAGSG